MYLWKCSYFKEAELRRQVLKNTLDESNLKSRVGVLCRGSRILFFIKWHGLFPRVFFTLRGRLYSRRSVESGLHVQSSSIWLNVS